MLLLRVLFLLGLRMNSRRGWSIFILISFVHHLCRFGWNLLNPAPRWFATTPWFTISVVFHGALYLLCARPFLRLFSKHGSIRKRGWTGGLSVGLTEAELVEEYHEELAAEMGEQVVGTRKWARVCRRGQNDGRTGG